MKKIFQSYVGDNKSYVGVSNSYIQDNKSYIGDSNSYIGDNKSYLEIISPTKELVSPM